MSMRQRVIQKANSHEGSCNCRACEAVEDESKMKELLKQLR